MVLEAIDGPAILMVLLIGGTYSASIALNHWQTGRALEADVAILVQRAGSVVVVGVGAFLATRIGALLLDWYAEHVASKTSTQLDDQLIPSFKRMLPILVYALAILWALAIFEIEISPLLATLGIGGIAIALAAQPTLSNYFAGTYVISEGEIEPGDFIEIEGGPSGFVGRHLLAEHQATLPLQQPDHHPQLDDVRQHDHKLLAARAGNERHRHGRRQLLVGPPAS